MMEVLVNYVDLGGRCILINGIEYLKAIHGKEKVIDWINRVKNLSRDITLILGVNGDPAEWNSISGFTYVQRDSMDSPKVMIVYDYTG